MLIFFLILSTYSCGGKWGADARKVSPDPRERVKKNLEEGKGFRLNDAVKNRVGRGGNFEFARRLALNQAYSYGGVSAPGVGQSTLGNANLTWENATTTDIGIDFNLKKWFFRRIVVFL